MADQVSDPVPGAGGDPERQRRAQAKSARPRMNVQQIHSWVDVEIEQAQRRGDFDNLPGAGKPLKNLDQNDPDWWIKGLIEREKLDLSAALPTVMALRQERRSFPESLAGMADEVAVRERLNDYNARVLEDRRRPVVGANSPAIAGRVDVEEMVGQWRLLRADRARSIAETGAPREGAAKDAAKDAVDPAAGAEAAPTGESGDRRWMTVLVVLAVLAVVGALVWWSWG